MVILMFTLMANQKFFWNSKKYLRSGLKKHCSGCFLKQPGSFFKQASVSSHKISYSVACTLVPFFLTKFFYEFYWQLFLKLFWQKNNFEWSSWGLRLWRIKIFFEIPKKILDRALKNIVPDVSWSSSGLFSYKQVFCHINSILSSMYPS